MHLIQLVLLSFHHIFGYGRHDGLKDSSKGSHKTLIGRPRLVFTKFQDFLEELNTAISAEISRCMSKCAQTLCKNMVKDTVKVANSYAILTMLMRKQWIHRNKRDATAPIKNIQDNALFWVTHASNFAGCRFLDLSLYTRQLPRLREGEDIEFNLAMALKPFSAMARQCSWPNRPRHFQ